MDRKRDGETPVLPLRSAPALLRLGKDVERLRGEGIWNPEMLRLLVSSCEALQRKAARALHVTEITL